MTAGQAGFRPRGRVGVFSRGILAAPHLRALLDAASLHFRPGRRMADQLDYVVGWGRKKTAAPARAYARAHGLPFVALEDGFLRSVGLGVQGAPALSIAVDDVGMYYDATAPSRLEMLLQGSAPDSDRLEDPALLQRADAAMVAIVEAGLSKYNASSVRKRLPPSERPRVLVVDQTAGDLSLTLGLAPPGGVRDVLEAACREHPDAEILLKTHPDVLSGKRDSSAGARVLPAGVVAVTDDINPITLLQQVDHVYVATSQLGFEALMVGKPVTCFGVPFYAGWGLTDDRNPIERRSRARSLRELFAAAYLCYCRFVDPVRGEPGSIDDVIAHLARQRAMFARNAGRHYCFGFRRWKHDFARTYLRGPDSEVHFMRDARELPDALGDDDRVVVWGQRDDDALRARVERAGKTLLRMEDGFLRSGSLGSDLTTPASLVLDGGGIYYDPHTASDLERILQTADFDDGELRRAAGLREAILGSRVSKYGYGRQVRVASAAPPGAQVVLVPGQVQDDASIKLGAVGVCDNLDLLRAAREARPEAWVVFKPHPDVLSGNRAGGATLRDFLAHCDELVTDVHISACLDVADEVHTMTSQVGFEALMRGITVVTYGQPFYSGWGLTEDRHPLPRRSRRLSVDALVAGALIRYPRYVHPRSGFFVEPEVIVDYLANAPTTPRRPYLLRQARRLWRSLSGTADVG